MQGSGACWPGPQRLGAEMLEQRREPRLSWDCKAPRVCGPGAWGPGPQGVGPGAPGGWGITIFRKPPGGEPGEGMGVG